VILIDTKLDKIVATANISGDAVISIPLRILIEIDYLLSEEFFLRCSQTVNKIELRRLLVKRTLKQL